MQTDISSLIDVPVRVDETAMKSLAQPSFFRVFDLLLGTANPGLKDSAWRHDGTSWERERHSFTGATHGQTIEIFTVTRFGKRGWSAMIVKEYWWAGRKSTALKVVRWAKPIEGRREDILNWFRAQEAALGRASSGVSRETQPNEAETAGDFVDDTEEQPNE
jgi:hypothetical protein